MNESKKNKKVRTGRLSEDRTTYSEEQLRLKEGMDRMPYPEEQSKWKKEGTDRTPYPERQFEIKKEGTDRTPYPERQFEIKKEGTDRTRPVRTFFFYFKLI